MRLPNGIGGYAEEVTSFIKIAALGKTNLSPFTDKSVPFYGLFTASRFVR